MTGQAHIAKAAHPCGDRPVLSEPVRYNYRRKGSLATVPDRQLPHESSQLQVGAYGQWRKDRPTRADFDRHESRGDSQGSESLIQNAGWGMEASMHGSASLDGFAHAAFGRD